MMDFLAFHALGVFCVMGIAYAVFFLIKSRQLIRRNGFVKIAVAGVICFALGFGAIVMVYNKIFFWGPFLHNTSSTGRMCLIFIFSSLVIVLLARAVTQFFQEKSAAKCILCIALIPNMLIMLQPIAYVWIFGPS